jgi:spore coat polysaccharide biosynthesis protein SpsF
MKILGIVQARTGSKRLKNKVLMKIEDKCILEILLERLKKSKKLDDVIVATTIKKEDDAIENLCNDLGIKIFRGSEKDVLSRFYNASKFYNGDVIVRITGDNPLTSVELIDEQVECLLKNNFNYVSTKNIILGLSSEVFTFDTLEISWKNAKEKYQREHVTPYIYEHPNLFKIFYLEPPEYLEREDIRLTIDTVEDFKLYLELQKHFDLVNVNIQDIIDFLDKNPQIKNINLNVRQKLYKEVEK